MTWIGEILNLLFLVLLFGLVVVALIHPVQPLLASVPEEAYLTPGKAFFAGEEPSHIASATVRSGIFSCLSMGIVYFLISLISAQSASLCGGCTNGSEVLGVIAGHYYGSAGTILLFAIVTMACLKTAVGLVTSCFSSINAVAGRYLPLFHFGLGWLAPALAGFIIGFIMYKRSNFVSFRN